MPAPDRFRQIPSVTSLLARDEIRSLLAHHPRAVVLGAIRRLLDGYRSEASGEEGSGRTREEWTSLLIAALPAEVSAGEEISLRRVINATGIVVHTNLGRAPLPEEAIRAISETASGYSNLEFDLAGGTRSQRLGHVGEVLGCPHGGGVRARREQQRGGGVLVSHGPGAGEGSDREPGGTRRDRGLLPHPGDHGGQRRYPRRGGDHEPDPRRRLRA